MKTKFKYIILILLVLSFQVVHVQASSIGINIPLPEDYINLTKLVKTNTELLKQYNLDAKILQDNYEKNGVILDSINQERSKSITAIAMENNYTITTKNLNRLQEEEITNLMEEYKHSKQDGNEYEITQRRYVVGKNLYINTTMKQEGKILQDEYYTIVDKTAISIAINSLGGQITQEELQSIINQIKYNDVTFQVPQQMYVITISAFLVSIVIIIRNEIKKRKNKIEVTEKEKELLTKEIIKHYHLEKSKKLGGYQLFFFITVVISLISIGYGMIKFLTQTPLEGSFEKVGYLLTIAVQNIMQIVGLVYIGAHIRKREENAKKKIQKALIFMFIVIILGSILKNIFVYFLIGQNVNYYLSELAQLFSNTMYLVVWYIYYKNSIRVAIYHQTKSMEEIIKHPETKIQKSIMEVRWIETKLVHYFSEKKALNFESSIELKTLPVEYIKSFYLSRLLRRKILKVKQDRIYLNEKHILNPKYERIRELKLVGIMVLAYFVIVLMIQGI